jgi:hypothetical protein
MRRPLLQISPSAPSEIATQCLLNHQEEKITMKHLLLVSMALVVPAAAHADETLKFRTILHQPDPTKAQDVGDTDGHRLLLARNVGLATFPDGSVGTASFVSIADSHKETTHWPVTYTNITIDDGSVLRLLIVSDSTRETGKITFKGTVDGSRWQGAFCRSKR